MTIEKSVMEAMGIFEKHLVLTQDQHALLKLLIERVFMQGKMQGFIEFKNISDK